MKLCGHEDTACRTRERDDPNTTLSDRSGKKVGIVPYGRVSTGILRELAENIAEFFALPVEVLPGVEILEDAFNPLRNQHHAAKVLEHLAGTHQHCYRILGITVKDLFLPIFTHVYGEAQLSGRAAVVSLHRLETTEDGAHLEREVFMKRATKVVVHELLHTFGLVHCRHADCLMQSVTKLSQLDAVPLRLCRSCLGLWREILKNLTG